MFKIRKPKRASQNSPPEPPNYDVPRWCARQCVLLLRMAHYAFDQMERMVQVMPPEQQALFQYLADVRIKPSFVDIMQLIDLSEERGLFSPDEAASLRAGKVRDIENPIPDIERTGDDARA